MAKPTSPIAIHVPYVPSTWHKISVMKKLAKALPHEKMADLGSGDGRIVIEFAKDAIESHGFEIHTDLALLSETKILEATLDDRAFIHIEDFWHTDLSPFSIVVIYGMTSIMQDLKEKLFKELRPGSRVISSIFHFPDWKPDYEEDNVSCYVIPESTK